MKELKLFMRDQNCLCRAIVEAAQQNRRYPSAGNPTREEAAKRGAALARLARMVEKGPPTSQKAGPLTVKGARRIAEPFGGTVTPRRITARDELRQRLQQGDLIIFRTVTKENRLGLHAEYVPPGGRDDIEIEKVLDVVDEEIGQINPFNVIEIEWR